MVNYCENVLYIEDFNDSIISSLLDSDGDLSFEVLCPRPDTIEEENETTQAIENWGTSADACDSQMSFGSDFIKLCFWSVGGPPDKWFQKLTKQHDEVNMVLNYCESGNCFAGSYWFRNGVTQDIDMEWNLEDTSFQRFISLCGFSLSFQKLKGFTSNFVFLIISVLVLFNII